MSRHATHSLAVLGLMLLGLTQVAANCGRTVDNANGCTQDSQCPSLFVCEVETGFCLCDNDNACDEGEFCNESGRCQAQTGCVSNDDCKSAERPQDICDTTTGECVTLSASSYQCVLDSHCPFGTICSGNLCQPGCNTNGDCALGDPCINGQCDPTPGACNENLYCDFGESCNEQTNTCSAHVDAASLCQWCQPQQQLTDPVPCGGNSCLFDSSVPPQSCTQDSQCEFWDGAYCNLRPCLEDTDCPGTSTCEGATFFSLGQCSPGYCQRTFCGSDECDDETNPCPKGYSCYTLITVTGQPCTAGGGQCTGGRACQVGGENEVSGFCSCIDDGDCSPGQTCTDPGPNGTCIQGTTCGPSSGLVCEDVR